MQGCNQSQFHDTEDGLQRQLLVAISTTWEVEIYPQILLEVVNCPLLQGISFRTVRRCISKSDSFFFGPLHQFLTAKSRPIVCNHHLTVLEQILLQQGNHVFGIIHPPFGWHPPCAFINPWPPGMLAFFSRPPFSF